MLAKTGFTVAIATSLLLLGTQAMAQGMGGGGQNQGPLGSLTRADTDGDGKISLAEFEASRSTLFTAIDTNGDKSISADELAAYATKAEADAVARMGDADRAKAMVSRRVDMFKAEDANGDGAITFDENKAAVDAQFEKLDTNKDGFISADEAQAMMRPR